MLHATTEVIGITLYLSKAYYIEEEVGCGSTRCNVQQVEPILEWRRVRPPAYSAVNIKIHEFNEISK